MWWTAAARTSSSALVSETPRWATGGAFDQLPPTAAWRHVDARDGFEVVFLQTGDGGYRFDGCTTAVEDGQAWVVRYEIVVDGAWRTRAAYVRGRLPTGEREVRLEADGSGHCGVGDVAAHQLDGCLDVDLESSSCTNTLPVHRLGLAPARGPTHPRPTCGPSASTSSALSSATSGSRTTAPGSDSTTPRPRSTAGGRLVYDASGLVLGYPGIATRDLRRPYEPTTKHSPDFAPPLSRTASRA
jgi:uncharacterized protein